MSHKHKKEDLRRLKRIFLRLNDEKRIKPAERALWNEFLIRADSGTIGDIDAILQDNPDLLPVLTENLFRKYAAVTAGDINALDRVVEDEIETFSKTIRDLGM